MTRLYYIENCGCDDTTCGLVRISDEDFSKFKSFIENLNKNSTYGCMPKIHVYEIDETIVHPWSKDDSDSDRLYLDDSIYTIDREWYWDNFDKPLI
jgi:hypothetical protein